MRKRYMLLGLALLASGCAMSEEVRRIEEVKRSAERREASRSTNLTGEQIFIRSCNTCHPGGKAGMGASLENLQKDFPDDEALKKFIRKGKGAMPGQPKEAINDQELESLVSYLRQLNQ